MNKAVFKKTGEELQNYLMTMSRHNVVKAKKGKGSFKRNSKYKIIF